MAVYGSLCAGEGVRVGFLLRRITEYCFLVVSTIVCRGDFNVVRHSEDKLGLGLAGGSMRDFSSLIDDLELIDLLGLEVVCFRVLQGLDEKETEGSLTDKDLVACEGVRKEYGQVVHMEEVSYRQRSRCLWLKNGDQNTKKIHHMTNAHCRVNQIGKMRVNGVLLSSEEEVLKGIVSFNQHLFRGKDETWRPGLDGVQFDAILEADR